MAKQSEKYSIKNLKVDFPNDEACLNHLFDKLHSRKCSCGGEYHQLFKTGDKGQIIGRRQFQCSKCRYQIAPTAGTMFEKSVTPLTSWFHAIFIFSNAKSGISAKEMERQLGVTYKTAWRILSLIRKSLKQNNTKLKGVVEMDEGHFGGKGNAGENNKDLGKVMKKKSAVIAAMQRGGEMKAKVIPNIGAGYVWGFMNENIDPQGTELMTDSASRYKGVATGYSHFMVNHSQLEFVRGNVHVNHIESFWAHLKRSIKGTYKVISKKHLQDYLDAFVWHYNNRHSDRLRFDALLGRIVRLT